MRFLTLLTTLLQSGVLVKHYHFSVLMAAMDTVSRYQALLLPLKDTHYSCLSIFMEGLNGSKQRVREKAVTLLSRYVAGLKENVVPFQQGILEAVQVAVA